MDDAADAHDLAALIGSRLCHDLINPLGAIGNGVELLAMSGNAGGPEMALIEDAVTDAQARIRFFRIAFGAASADQHVSRRELTVILEGLYGPDHRLKVDWRIPGDLARPEAKLILLALACAEHALPLGGDLSVMQDGDDLALSAKAKRINADGDLWALLGGSAPSRRVQPAEVQFLLLPREAGRANRRITTEIGENGLSLQL